VVDLIGGVKERVFPVGRLDKNTTGVLLLTNDGDMAVRLTHPRYKQRKIYHVSLTKDVTKADLTKLTEGVEIEDSIVKADMASYIDDKGKNEVGVEIHSGENRVVRRMFEALGYTVRSLDRVIFAGLTKSKLRRGQWRFLTDKEIAFLQMNLPKK